MKSKKEGCLSINQIEDIRREIQASKALLEHQQIVYSEMPPILRGMISHDPDKESINTRRQVSEALEMKIKRLQYILDTQSPQKATGRGKARLDAEIKKLEEIVRSREPSRRLVNARSGTPECDQAIQIGYKNTMDRAYVQIKTRLKYLYRLRHPDDPTHNLERLRK